ncbi:DsrE/DsrF/DrsH-like family protein [Halalkaliarchaeum sp. AArc-GB]|uniref:DsrE/DsrF/DrsH-like family protein n=1 Tax=Halalkaliarchaeum sp. AArc-GB TaxID=3074078 RepID=UPI00285EFBD8|nr:DsrE/DsrF/DrsH-like family protein [Halalkaliarchaeum sp. AArc-GB]MDR5673087.1 DsrE/DsrF/DrsH-like family protein [Halalkaliarchaeum sp. AArc-GB]
MSTETPDSETADDAGSPATADAEPSVEEIDPAELQARIEELEAELSEVKAATDDGQKSMTIISTKGSFDMAYPPLILASTAAAFGWDVVVFHTFWGLDILHEEKSRELKLSAVGNPSMPMPNALAALPGMDSVATKLMKRRIEENGTATIEELLELSLDTGVDLQACQMTMDLMGYEAEDLHDGVTTDVGAATALEHMADADVQLLI